MIAKGNREFDSLARLLFGSTRDVLLPQNNVVEDQHRARNLRDKADLDPRPEEITNLIITARQQIDKINAAIDALRSATE